jgi:hypothetical protein
MQNHDHSVEGDLANANSIMFPFCNLFKVHYNTCQGYVGLAN